MTIVKDYDGKALAGLAVLLDGAPLIDVMRAAAGSDPIARVRAMTKLFACEQESLAAAVVQALASIPESERPDLMGPTSGLVDVLAVISAGWDGGGHLLATAYEREPWLNLSPRIFVTVRNFRGVNLARDLFDTRRDQWCHNATNDVRARQRAMDLAETCEGHPEWPRFGDRLPYVDLVREYLPREKDKDLRARMAAFVAKHEAEKRKAELTARPGKAKRRARR